MRKLIDRIRADIVDFLEQRCDQLLIVSCSDTDAPIVLKIVQEVDQADASDAFLLFADDFVATSAYVSVVTERLREQVRTADGWLVEQGRDPFPPLPEAVSGQLMTPMQRLVQVMTYAVSLLPQHGGHRLLWAMVPTSIGNRQDYLDLVSAFLVRSVVDPGPPGLRILFRDQPGTAAALPRLAGGIRPRIIDVDLGPAALRNALKEEVADATLPTEQRAAAALQRALLDAAHGHTRKALKQLRGLLGHYQRNNEAALQALVLNGIGDIFLRDGNLDQACHWYECAVPLAVKAESPVLLHTAVRNLADIARDRRELARAEQLYDAADKLAGKLLYIEGLAYAREQRGLVQEQQRAFDRAAQSWEAAAGICRTASMTPQLRINLAHLARGYRNQGKLGDVDRVELELRQLKAEEQSR